MTPNRDDKYYKGLSLTAEEIEALSRLQKKKKPYSKFIVFLVILLNTVFAFTTLYVFLQTSTEPVALISTWFAFTVGELWLLAGIKKKKIDTDKRRDYDDVI